MSTDYRIHVKRKCDDKTLAIFHANLIKTLLDSKHCGAIHCSVYNVDKVKFTYDELVNLSDIIFKEIQINHLKISKLNLMLLCAKTDKAIEDIKSDIEYTKSYLEDDLKYQLANVYELIGHIECCVENLYNKKDEAAYSYNAKDLKTSEQKDFKTIWCHDVYCEIESC